MLPTKEKANIIKHDLGHIFYSKEALNKETVSMLSNQHLYFLSDEEEIKEGDWCYDKVLNVIFQTDEHTDFKYINQTDMVFVFNNVLKIIATTDDSLAIPYDGKTPISENWGGYKLPQPSQSFIEKYVEEYNNGNVITEVRVEYEFGGIEESYFDGNNEKLPLRLKVNPKDNTITIRKVKDSWSRDELIILLNKFGSKVYGEYTRNETMEDFTDKWIEQNL